MVSGSRASRPARRVRTWRGARTPDKTIAHFPGGDCECGADLGDAEDLGVTYSHQVTDIPEATATVRDLLHDLRDMGTCGTDAPQAQTLGQPGQDRPSNQLGNDRR
jgi:hypothetical protein